MDGRTEAKGYDVRRHPAQLVRRVHQRAAQLFNQLVPERRITTPQFVLLVTLLQSGPAAQNRIGQLVSMDPSTASAVIRKLMGAGYLKRTRSEADQRVQMIELTEAGRACAEAHIPVSLRAEDELLAPLSPAERLLFTEFLDRILSSESPQS